MIFADQMRDHQERCQLPMLKLRILASGEPGTAISRQVTDGVREATNAVLAEAEAAGRAVLAAMAGGRRQSEAETFLWVRLTRLARAADEAVGAARSGDAPGLRRHLDRFNALTAAFCAVQQAVSVPAPRQAR